MASFTSQNCVLMRQYAQLTLSGFEVAVVNLSK